MSFAIKVSGRVCYSCRRDIIAGEIVTWGKGTPRKYRHVNCPENAQHPVIERNVTKESPNMQHRQFPLLLDLITARQHVYLYGAPGGGKSTAAKQSADVLGIPFGYISLDEQSADYLLMGYKDATGAYHRTLFRDCYENGGVFVIEELDNASGSLLTSLNCALENGHCAFPDGLVQRHADFILIGAGNTSGRGAHPAFPERRPFDAAFADRFFYVEWQYDLDLERSIARSFGDHNESLVDWVISARRYCEEYGLRVLLTPRATQRLCRLSGLPNITTDLLIDGILKGVDKTTREKILTANPFPTTAAKAA